MSQKWNLQDIRPSTPAQPKDHASATPRRAHVDIATRRPSPAPLPPQPAHVFDDVGTIDVIDGKSRKRKRLLISILSALIIIAAGYGANVMLTGAEIIAYPKFKDVTVQATITAYREPKSPSDLGYELLTLEAQGERQVKASGQETVSERAQGKILIYNAHSPASQRLIKNTRFESPDGLIFRITESVEVPGTTKGQNGEVVPGVISAEVFADGTGEQYNLEPTRFTIPGLKGSDQFNTVYAESTESFTGGFEGNRYIISDADYSTAQQSLHVELRDSLLSKLESERPAGFILYDNAVSITFQSLPSTAYGDEMATIKEKAILQVPMFKEDEFARYLAEQTIAGYENEPVTITDPKLLSFAYRSATTTLSDISNVAYLEFDLIGQSQIVWDFDTTKLRNDLAGMPEESLNAYLSDQKALNRARATIRPFWESSFPSDPDKITVTTVIGE